MKVVGNSMKIAVGFVHGIGKQKEHFHEAMAGLISKRLGEICPAVELVSKGIYWADITDRLEDELKEKLAPDHLHWNKWIDARGYAISFLGDAIAYQPLPHKAGDDDRNYIYTAIHERFYEKLQELAQCTGPSAPLCIISHSLGTIIASNFIYDLQNGRLPSGKLASISEDPSALVRGDTLTHFYTMGSPIAIWTMRYNDFGKPISFPSPALLAEGLPYGEWVNFYDKDDVIAYPLKRLSAEYDAAVTEDVEVRNPGFLASTPLNSHGGYYRSKTVIERIAKSLADLYDQTTRQPIR
ncbi:hypothetical protein BCV73_13400 [Paenibacillus sp. SSG-1]|nr:hypothetical protein BCV73_13400 [Paenibacillus sp. SSG-1]